MKYQMLRRFSSKWMCEIYESASNAKGVALCESLRWHFVKEKKDLEEGQPMLAGLLLGDHWSTKNEQSTGSVKPSVYILTSPPLFILSNLFCQLVWFVFTFLFQTKQQMHTQFVLMEQELAKQVQVINRKN